MPDRLLLVEDTASLRLLYETILTRAGHRMVSAGSLAEARGHCAQSAPRLVLLDLQLPDGDGLELLAQLPPETRVIVVTANGSINRAVQAMRAGAFDFLVKPFDENRLLSAVENALATAPAMPEEAAGHDAEPPAFAGFIGRSPAMQEIYRMVRAIGRSTATVFITGESGTGKEVCARAIHGVSNRARRPFWNAFSDSTGRFHVGHWTSEPGVRRVAYDETEFCVILEGRVRLEGEGGAVEFGPGEAFVVEGGFAGTW
ncbi:hypothetical protein CNY89_17385, partial [Amaricoccus sp. HAR-UPW-R2A-40]